MTLRGLQAVELLSHRLVADLVEKEDHSEVLSYDTSSSSAILNTSGSYNVFKLVIIY